MTKSCRKKTKTMNYPDNQICTYSICKDVYFLLCLGCGKPGYHTPPADVLKSNLKVILEFTQRLVRWSHGFD